MSTPVSIHERENRIPARGVFGPEKGPRLRKGEPYRAIGTAYRYRAADVSIKRRVSACA